MSEIRKLHITVSADNLRPNDKIIRRAPDIGLLPQFDIIREEKIETKRFYMETIDYEDFQLAGPFFDTEGREFFEINVPDDSYGIPAREFIGFLRVIYPNYIRPGKEWDENQ